MGSDQDVTRLSAVELLAVLEEPEPTLDEKLPFLAEHGLDATRAWLAKKDARRVAAGRELDRRTASALNSEAVRTGKPPVFYSVPAAARCVLGAPPEVAARVARVLAPLADNPTLTTHTS